MPTRRIFSRIHAIAGVLAFVTIVMFMSSSLGVELWGSAASVAGVKQAIAWALLILVPALIATGASGFSMAGSSPKGMLATKLKRMRLIAGNGILVLVPSVLFLAWKAGQNQFDTAFVAGQIVEFAAGSINLALMGLNIRDGLRLTGRLRTPRRQRSLSERPTPATP
jgi:hypothetical protein